MVELPLLSCLDDQYITIEERVAANNRHHPPMEITAANNHTYHVSKACKKPSRLRFRYYYTMDNYRLVDCVHSTLTQLDEPYPMLVLCGPMASGKGYFTQLLVEEFPSFFGLG